MSAAKGNIKIEAKSGFELVCVCTDDADVPVDLTGYTARAAIKKTASDVDAVAVFTCTIPTPTDGAVVCKLTAAQTAVMNDMGTGAWDLLLQPPVGEPFRLLQGSVTISPGVTDNG